MMTYCKNGKPLLVDIEAKKIQSETNLSCLSFQLVVSGQAPST